MAWWWSNDRNLSPISWIIKYCCVWKQIYSLLSLSFSKVAYVLKLAPWKCVGDKAICKGVEICIATRATCSFGVVVGLQNNWLCFRFCLNAFSCTVCIASSRLYIWLMNLLLHWAQKCFDPVGGASYPSCFTPGTHWMERKAGWNQHHYWCWEKRSLALLVIGL